MTRINSEPPYATGATPGKSECAPLLLKSVAALAALAGLSGFRKLKFPYFCGYATGWIFRRANFLKMYKMDKPQIETHEYYDFVPCLNWMQENVPGFDKDEFWSWACELPGFSNDTFFTFLNDEKHPMALMIFAHFGHSFYICW